MIFKDLKIYYSMLLSTIPKSPPKIIRENTYTDSREIKKSQFLFLYKLYNLVTKYNFFYDSFCQVELDLYIQT